MVKNFVYLQEKLGLIPNGNRQYYITRTQPPVLAFMVDLLYQQFGLEHIKPYIDALEKENQFWMDGKNQLNNDNVTHRRIVRMPNGETLNRYWDDVEPSIPRQESHREDFALAKNMNETDAKQLYRNIRAAAESGWDFTARWFKDRKNLSTIQITSIAPIDLNALLYGQEKLLAKYIAKSGDQEKADFYQAAAEKRKQTINTYCWNENAGFYFDYNIKTNAPSDFYSLAGVVPIFTEMASQEQAAAIKKQLEQKFLQPGGLVSTLIKANQQWDYPNGWAPLQWFAVKGLLNYNHQELALEIAKRWVKTLRTNFDHTKMLMEKYNVCQPDLIAKGGEYSVQEGFGWTNGIALKFIELTEK